MPKFPKSERLYEQKLIDKLFAEGNSYFHFPFKIFFLECAGEKPIAKVLISVPKKNIRKSHDRNRVKRLIRESYRLHKDNLLEQLKILDKTVCIAFVFTDNKLPTFKWLEEKMIVILPQILQQIEMHSK